MGGCRLVILEKFSLSTIIASPSTLAHELEVGTSAILLILKAGMVTSCFVCTGTVSGRTLLTSMCYMTQNNIS